MRKRMATLASMLLTILFVNGAAAQETQPLWAYNTGNGIFSISMSDDGSYFVVGTANPRNFILLFHKDNADPLWSYELDDQVLSVSISADGKYIAAGGGNSLYFFSKGDNVPLWLRYQAFWGLSMVTLSRDGSYIAAAAGEKVYLFSKNDNTLRWFYSTGGDIYSLSISPDGDYIGAGSRDGKAYFFDKWGAPLWSYQTGDDMVSVYITSDENYAFIHTPLNFHLFRLSSGALLWSSTTVTRGASLGGGYFVVAGEDTLSLFQLADNAPRWKASYPIRDVDVSFNGTYMITMGTGDAYKKIYLFHQSDNSAIWEHVLNDEVGEISISGSGRYSVVSDFSNNVYLFSSNVHPTPPTVLLCENKVGPTNITNTSPSFSAVFNDRNPDDVAVYYRIIVGTAPGLSDKWDSGKQQIDNIAVGARSSQINYGGLPLDLDNTYYWQIKFWDRENEGLWSAVAQFTLVASAPSTYQEFPIPWWMLGFLAVVVAAMVTVLSIKYAKGRREKKRVKR